MPASNDTADSTDRHLNVLGAAEANTETVELQVETNQSHVRDRHSPPDEGPGRRQVVAAERSVVAEPGFVAHTLLAATAELSIR